MHLGDSIFIFILALVLFGPKKLPEMARQIGKLMAEFRRASNDFRLQIDEELRTMERQEQLAKQGKQEAERAAALGAGASAVAEPALLPSADTHLEPPASLTGLASETEAPLGTDAGTLQILPPAVGEQISAGSPYAVSGPIEDHPLLHVESIPVDLNAEADQPTGLAAAEANAARLQGAAAAPEAIAEPEQATLQNG